MSDAFRKALSQLSGVCFGFLVVVFNGHAVDMNGHMMWAPEEAHPERREDHLDMVPLCGDLQELHSQVVLDRWTQGMKPIENLSTLVVANCCRTASQFQPGTFTRHVTTSGGWWRRRQHREGSLAVLYACDPNRPACDDLPSNKSSNTVFVRLLLKELNEPHRQPVQCLMTNVADGMKNETNGRQEVWRLEVRGSVFAKISLRPEQSSSDSSTVAGSSAASLASSSLLPSGSSASDVHGSV
eukprot:TRINITY_DN25910_c0_g2_i2.p1 TRINITY_DN25910_c0_g2~~TRINITY_DN25910_c0_g2_i2.p1  ORF type:complete len:241 (-),score=20.98 TRINITY_DN25910_c0_g2_i2:335-1057(-)